MPEARVAAVIAAGGAGRRLGGEVAKQFTELAGRPLLLHTLRPFLDDSRFVAIVLVLPAEEAAEPPAWLAALAREELRLEVVAGGRERGDSVRLGVEATPENADVVLVHDGVRPLVDAGVIERVLDALARGHAGAVAALPVSDTIKEVDESGFVVRTLDRSRLWAVQTPQGFPRAVILDAYRRAAADGVVATDDAALVERYGGVVALVEGSPDNLKVTRPGDLALAEAIIASRRRREGTGGSAGDRG